VIAEPEPVEYVRVCDVYGTGFYYMPGTETCLKVSGYVRYDIGVGDLYGNADVLDKKDASEGIFNLNDTYDKRARAALRLDARTETELGTLRSYFQVNFDWDTDVVGGITTTNDPGEAKLNHAYIELGGFLIGKTDSLFTTFTSYIGNVVKDDSRIGEGPFDTHIIQYTFDAGNGFTAAVALEEGSGALYTLDDYVPHIVGGVGYTGGWGSAKVVAAYDAVWEEYAVKGRLDVKATETISAFVMAAYKSGANDGLLVADDNNLYGTWNGDWAIWGGLSAKVNEKTTVNLQLSYDEDDEFYAVADVNYELVPGFTITPGVGYYNNDVDGFDDEFGGYIRFQRNF
jgi:hypothetical protein